MQKNNTLAKLLSTSLWVITLAIITLSVSLLSSAQEIDGSVEVSFKTSKGDFVVELYPEKAPITVKNFVSYVASGYYDNTLFHRVVDGFLVQGGGFNKGMVAKKPNEAIVNESLNGLKNERGMLGMARKKLPFKIETTDDFKSALTYLRNRFTAGSFYHASWSEDKFLILFAN